jgi:hypothetical protein
LGSAGRQFRHTSLAAALEVLDEQLHLRDLADLRFDDAVGP